MIRIDNVSKTFVSRGVKTEALRSISLEVKDNEFFSVVGPTGCGKTTLLRIIAGTVKPTSGKVVLNGTKVEGPSKEVAMVFQTFNLFPWRTVSANIEFGLEVRDLAKEERRVRAMKYAELVGLEGFENHFPNQLSGGMQQKVSLARALAVEPKLLLMDEPFANLDAQTREFMQSELLKIWEAARKSILFVTHSIEEAIFLSDRLAVLTRRPGQIMEIIEVDLPRPRHEELRSDERVIRLKRHIWGELKEAVAA